MMPHFNRRNLVKLAGSLPALGIAQPKAAAARTVAVIEPGNDVTKAALVIPIVTISTNRDCHRVADNDGSQSRDAVS